MPDTSSDEEPQTSGFKKATVSNTVPQAAKKVSNKIQHAKESVSSAVVPFRQRQNEQPGQNGKGFRILNHLK